MSKEALAWASSQKIDDRTLSNVVRAIAYLADRGTFECTKSQAAIAKEAHFSVRSLRRALIALEILGVITKRARSNGFSGRTTDAIKLAEERNFDLTREVIIRIKKSLQPAKSSESNNGCNRPKWPLQPAKMSGDITPVNTDYPFHGETLSDGREVTYAHATCDTSAVHEDVTPDQDQMTNTNVVWLKARGAL
ncbi:hypothetical protein [Pseudomonas monteilii]|uniref:hypothetical protein n=1 Tax=Pseudomonas monteilii TaxID=76759 RepID=UPI001377952C|nr:hypothetical protein [Pseudomonas monteilii]NBB07881.1 hypothetical protein [Pseudomonas monteilii]